MADLQLQPSIRHDLRSQAVLRLAQRMNAPLPAGAAVSPWQPQERINAGTARLIAEPWDHRSPPRSGTVLVCIGAGTTGSIIPAAVPAETIITDGTATWRAAVAGTIDLTPLLVSWIEQVDESALPYLLWQFDLLAPFWQLLMASSQRVSARSLVKLGISLHALRGTPAAITRMLAACGWIASVQEGQAVWGGTDWPDAQGWAVCRLLVQPTPLADMPADISWRSDITYQPGALVTYPGPHGGTYLRPDGSTVSYAGDGTPGGYFLAVGASHGVPPYYREIGDVGALEWLSDVGALRTKFWIEAPTYRLISEADARLLTAAFDFFAPRRCWLDRILLQVPGFEDLIGGAIDSFELQPVDSLGRIRDFVLAALPSVADDLVAAVPLHDGSYHRRRGLTYGGTRVGVVDDGLIVNGEPWVED
jgi:hypothetical protein